MKIQNSSGTPPLRRELIDPRSTGKPAAAPRKVLLNDRRSTR